MVDSIIEPLSRAWVVTARSVLGPSPPGPGSAAVVHARVTHRQHRCVLVELEAAVDDLAEEQRVATELHGLAHLAVDERDRLVEDRRAGRTGLVNLRTMARSSCAIRFTLNTPPSATSSWVNASRSTPTPTSLGSNESCVTQLIVMPLRRSPARDPST